jgi:hypothetical protein
MLPRRGRADPGTRRKHSLDGMRKRLGLPTILKPEDVRSSRHRIENQTRVWMAPAADDPALLVLGEPALAKPRLEFVERRARRDLDDDVDVLGRVSQSSTVAPPTNMTSSTSSPSAAAAISSSSTFTLRGFEALDQKPGGDTPDAWSADPDGIDEGQPLAEVRITSRRLDHRRLRFTFYGAPYVGNAFPSIADPGSTRRWR